MKFPNAWAAAMAALLAAASSGCLRRETQVERADRDQVLLRGIGYEVSDIDPQLGTGTAEQAVISGLFEGLVTEDPRDLHPVPGVAYRWDISPDGLSYTFFLRPEARWSNGKPVTADDFVQSWKRILTPSLAADNANLLFVIQGAEAFNKGVTDDFSRVGVAALGERTLRVALEHPAPHFLSLLTHWSFCPVPVGVIAGEGPLYKRGNPWARPGHLVGNGPFLLESWEPNKVIALAKSPTYWDASHVALNGIRLYPIDSLDAEEREFRAGQLHLTDALPVGRIDAYRSGGPELKAFLRIDPYLATYFYRLNTGHASLGDPRIRKALALAVDRRAIVDHILRGGQKPAETFVPPGIDGYEPPAGLATDFAGARSLLAAAGYPGGKGLPPFELLFNDSENNKLIAEAVQEMWRRELGIDARLVNEDLKSVLAARRVGDYQILRSSWVADYEDPASFLDVWRSGSGDNFTGWSSPGYDALLFAAERTPDAASRNERLREAEGLLLQSVPIIPIFFYTHVFLMQPSVQGWYPNLLDHHPYKYVRLNTLP
ncbi:MAG: peptide ABC transporter substrate-binding protein [Opitutaceae bacterium]|jgi:oligopeptide transport system substrate-binding protein